MPFLRKKGIFLSVKEYVTSVSALALFQHRGSWHIVVAIIVTAVEVAGLAIWFYLHKRGVSEGIGSAEGLLFIYLAAGLLFVFLLIEHIVSQFAHNIAKTQQKSVSLKQFEGIIGFTLLEVSIWIVWLLLINFNQLIVAGVFFFAGLYFEHQFTNNVKNDLRFIHISRKRAIVVGLLVFTAFEFGGAVIWVNQDLLVPSILGLGLIAMAIGSFIEHYVADNVGRIPE